MADKYPSQTKEATRERVRKHRARKKQEATHTDAVDSHGRRLFWYPGRGWLWI